VKRHGLDPFSLVFGASFALLGLTFLFARVDVTALRWIWPVPLIILGGLIIAVGARGERADRMASESDGEDYDPSA
jgi:hypothetical protein